VTGRRIECELVFDRLGPALLAHAAKQGLDVPPEWVFEDDGCSGATLVRPALERLRDLVCQVPVEVVLCYAPDRLARKYAYQALLVEEFARAGTEVCFLSGPTGDRPEDALLVQFQGMIAEYEKAQIIERTRRGKAHRAKAGSVNVLSGAPYGYRYVRKSDHVEARYEPVEPEASVVRELFGRYVADGCSIADLARWLSEQQIPTRTGKARWDRSTVWGMLRNPAYAGRAAFSKTMRTDQQARLTRPARLAGRSISTNPLILDRPRQDWVEIAVPPIVGEETFQLAARRLADNQRFAARNTKVPSLLQGLAACERCGYAYYRTSARTSARRLYYYRCLGSDDYRYEGGRVCANLPVRADYLDQVVWEHVTGLLADPALVRGELDRRLAELRAANPATATKARLEREQARTATAISRLVEAYQEQLLSLNELRGRMPALRAKQQTLHAQLDALEAQLADHQTTLKLAENLEGFLGRLRDTATTASVPERQRVLRLLVKEILIGPERVVVRHRIPVTSPEPAPGYLLRGRSPVTPARQHRLVGPGRLCRPGPRRAMLHQGRTGAAATPWTAQLPARAVRGRLPGPRRRHPPACRGHARPGGGSACPDGPSPVGGQDDDHPHRPGPRLSRVAHPASPQARHQPALRLHLPGAQGRQGREGEGQDRVPENGQEPAARRPAPPAQPDAAGLVRLLPARRLARRLQVLGPLCVDPSHRMAASQAPPDHLEGPPPPLLRWRWWPQGDKRELFNPDKVRTTRYPYRGAAIPTPWPTTG
jgi:site-specific DNA recombinase